METLIRLAMAFIVISSTVLTVQGIQSLNDTMNKINNAQAKNNITLSLNN